MKKLICYTGIVFFAAIAVAIASDSDDIIVNEKAAWHAFKDKNADEFKKLVSDQVITVYADGMHNMQHELDQMTKTVMKSFSFGDFNVTFTDKRTAIITYQVTIDAKTDGKDASGTFNTASVWRSKKGQWQAVFHSQTKAEPAPKSGG